MMSKSVTIIGQFPPPITGEGESNIAVKEILLANGFLVKEINTCIIDSANDVGKFSVKKFYRLFGITALSLAEIIRSDFVYMTPGQTTLGLFRFLPLLFIGRLLGRRIILHWHGYGLLSLVKKWPRLVGLYFGNKVINVFLTHDLLTKMAPFVDTGSVRVIKNFFQSESATRTIGMEFDPSTALSVLYLGSLMPEKGIDLFCNVAKMTDFCKFVVCGSGSNHYVKLLTGLSNEGVLDYRGIVKGQAKVDAFMSADVFVLQTSYATEGVPLTIIEAMSYGLAIITTDHNGIPETVGDAALFVDASSTDSLIGALRLLHKDRHLLMDLKRKSLEKSRLYSYEAFSKSVLSLFIDEV